MMMGHCIGEQDTQLSLLSHAGYEKPWLIPGECVRAFRQGAGASEEACAGFHPAWEWYKHLL